jgi:hypothetical protein
VALSASSDRGATGVDDRETSSGSIGSPDAASSSLGKLGSRRISGTGTAHLPRSVATAPWSSFATDRARSACVTRTALNLLRVCASVSAPIIPETSARVLAALGEAEAAAWPEPEADALPRGATIAVSAPLFPRINPERVAEFLHPPSRAH